MIGLLPALVLRKAVRDVRGMGIRALLLVLVIGAGIGTAGGIALALHDVRASRDGFYADQALADLDIRLSRAVPVATLQAVAGAAAARAAETRLVVDGLASHAATTTSAEIVVMSPRPRLDRLAVVAGRGLSDDDPSGAVVEADYAHQSGLHVGDRLDLSAAGHRLTVRVRGLARSPEYLLATASPEYLIPQPGSLAVVFLPTSSLPTSSPATGLGVTGRANDLVLDLPRAPSAAAAQQFAAGLPVARLVTRDQQYSRRFTDADLHSFALFVPVIGGVFAVVAFVLIGLSLRRLVHAQRRELGTLLAIGCRRRVVLASALLPAAVLAVPGAVIAVAVSIGVARIVAAAYTSAVGFPVVVTSYAAVPLVGTAGTALVATLAAAALPARRLLRLAPARAMRGEAAVRFAPPRWLRAVTGGTGPAVTYAGRSLTRRPLLTAGTVLSLALATGLGISLNLLITSTNRSVDEAFAGQGWTVTADLGQPVTVEGALALARTAGAGAAEPVVTGPALLDAGGRDTDTVLVGLPAGPHLLRPRLTAGRMPAAGEIVLSEQSAAALHVHVGRRVRVSVPGGSRELTVSGIARTVAAQQAYARYTDAASLLALPGRATAMYLTASLAAARQLATRPGVARVTTLAAARTGMHALVRELTALIRVLLAISLAVGALFLVSSLALSLLDREGEFATLRALGYGRARITAVLSTEALAQSAVAGLLAVPAALVIAWPLAARIGQAWFRIGIHVEPSDFTLVIVLVLALALAGAIGATRRVQRLDIAAAVRSRLIG